MSSHHFQRTFTRIAGESCRAMHRRLLFERAAWDLQNTTYHVLEIARRAGFESSEPFARAFRRKFGSTATEYREAAWFTHSIGTPCGVHYTIGGDPEFHPIARSGDGPSYAVKTVAPIHLAARRHRGAPGMIAKTFADFIQELRGLGVDHRGQPMYSYTRNQSRSANDPDVETFVAIHADAVPNGDFEYETIGGCHCLIVQFIGTGRQIGDFWWRVWIETMPHCGYEQDRGACFQSIRLISQSKGPPLCHVRIHVPVRQKRAFSVIDSRQA